MSQYTPALGFRILTRFYDGAISRLLPEQEFREALLLQTDLKPGLRVLDFGAGTGTLTLLAKQRCPACDIAGVDVDEAILEKARRKREQRGLDVDYRLLAGDDLPFPPHHFDRVLSSLVFHHLTNARKAAALREIRRVLKPTGERMLRIGAVRQTGGCARVSSRRRCSMDLKQQLRTQTGLFSRRLSKPASGSVRPPISPPPSEVCGCFVPSREHSCPRTSRMPVRAIKSSTGPSILCMTVAYSGHG